MHILWRGDTFQRLRLVSGLILFAFAATHFLNHALGLISIDWMMEAQAWRQVVTRSLPGTIVLAGALATHMALAIYKVANRATLRMPAWELVQLALGLAIPVLLLPHIVNTRLAHTLFDVKDTYIYELLKLWPASAPTQSLLLLMVWLHGCIGIHFWMRLYAPYRRWQPVLLGLALIIPFAALGGFMVAGRGITVAAENQTYFDIFKRMTNWPSDEVAGQIAWLRTIIRWQYLAVLAVAVLYFTWGRVELRLGPRARITYIGGPTIDVPAGPTLLEMSRMSRIPHASVCGGRARCSTCRVRIERGSTEIPPATFPEITTLASISAPDNVRLACQIRPRGRLVVTRLLKAGTAGPASSDIDEAEAAGVEKSLAVMFVDLRDFTKLAESRLPFDVVFILNEFFGLVGTAISDHGGRIDKFMGDGLLAVFGERSGVEAGCREAVLAARAIDLALDHVNEQLHDELGRTLMVGIGIHAGALVLGRIGFGENVDLTVVGMPVNIASRLEALSKEKGLQVVLSRDVARLAGLAHEGDFAGAVSVRGVEEPVEVIGFASGRTLPSELAAAPAPPAGAASQHKPGSV